LLGYLLIVVPSLIRYFVLVSIVSFLPCGIKNGLKKPPLCQWSRRLSLGFMKNSDLKALMVIDHIIDKNIPYSTKIMAALVDVSAKLMDFIR